MKTKKTPAIIAVVALVVGLGTAASADLLSIPSMIPDVCFFGSCVQFTQSSALANIQHVIGQIQQLKNEAQNLATLPTSPSAAMGEVQQILGTVKTANPASIADTMAAQIANGDQSDAAEAARNQALARAANGAQSQAQATNGLLQQIDGTTQKQLTLSVAQQTQDAQARADFVQGMSSAPAAEPVGTGL